MLSVKERMALRSKAKTLESITRIGKNGLTENTIKEIDKLLKKRKLIKIKLLKGSMEKSDRKEITKNLVDKTNSELIEQVGFVVVLYRK